jgi:hypothetical protein
MNRLFVTLRFLANWQNYEDGNITAAISPQAVGVVMLETCEAISEELKQ